ncbi:MAG: HAD-IB family phosphatase [archaeon]
MENVLISNPLEFERKKATIKAGGPNALHIVADFDKTLTTGLLNGEKRRSLVEMIRKYNYLTPEYAPRSYELFNTYHPFEEDQSLPMELRKAKMVEWWSTHVEWMSQCGMSKSIVEKIVREQELGPREGLHTFLDTLQSKAIPLLILSSSVTDLIEGFLQKDGVMHPNIHVISNKYTFDANGKVTGYENKIVHSMNKDETVIHGTPYESMIHDRKNVLLLGDSLDDVGMVAGFDHDVVIKIGFLNDDSGRLSDYQKVYDVVIVHDGNIDFVNELLNEIIP